jgi:hypothetical protein
VLTYGFEAINQVTMGRQKFFSEFLLFDSLVDAPMDREELLRRETEAEVATRLRSKIG